MNRTMMIVLLVAASLSVHADSNPKVSKGADAGRNYGREADSGAQLLYPPSYEECLASGKPVITRRDIYHEGWIDLNKNGRKDIYEDPAQPVEKRLDDLISRMTVEEKTAQMATLYGYKRVLKDHLPTVNWKNEHWKDGVGNIDEELTGFFYYNNTNLPGCAYLWPPSRHAWALNEVQRFFIEDTRLGVPAEFSNEGIRGVEHFKATDFPTQLGLGQTWDRALIRKVGEITAKEGHALGFANVYAPILDVIRDPRWGRCEESYGEDPFLVSELAIQMVQGLQANKVVSTMKHFCVYSDNMGAREGFARVDPQCGPREAENLHLWPYDRVIRAASPLGVMASYNDVDGVPVQGSSYYLTDILRHRMGFRGYVVSDSDAVEYLSAKHHTAADYKEAVRQSVLAGLNVRTTFTPPEVFTQPLRELVNEGAIPLTVLDERVRDILRVKLWEGIFDAPYRPLKPADEIVLHPAHVAVALQAARESLVLLKNEGNLLPLDSRKVRRIAVVGPNADDRNYAQAHYGPLLAPVTTVRDALEKKFGKGNVLYARGCEFLDERWPDTEIMWQPPTASEQAQISAAVSLVRGADAAIVVVGDTPRGNPTIKGTSGENCSRTGIALTGRQDDLIRAVAATGKPVVVVNISGRPTALNWANKLCPAILQAFFPGMEGGTAIVEAVFGDYNPGGKLTCTVPKTTGQLQLNFPSKPAANVETRGVSVTGVLWSFGEGLSYTKFSYTNLVITPRRQSAGGSIAVSFDVTNTGGREGDEIPQMYLRQLVSSVTTYEQNLRGFERIHLKPAETRTVTFAIEPDFLAIWNPEMKRVVEPGTFEVQIGASSSAIRLRGQFEIVR